MFDKLSSQSYPISFFSYTVIFSQLVSTPLADAQMSTSNHPVLPTKNIVTLNGYFQPDPSYLKMTSNLKSVETISSVAKISIENITANAGTDVRLNCTNSSMLFEGQVAWIRKSAKENESSGRPPPSGFITNPKDGSIKFTNIKPMQDDGIYTCVVANTNRKLKIIRLIVKSIPSAVANLSVIPHSVYALVTWQMPVSGDGGYPIQRYVLSHRLDKSHLATSDNLTDDTIEELQGNPTKFFNNKNSLSIPKEEYEWKGNIHPKIIKFDT